MDNFVLFLIVIVAVIGLDFAAWTQAWIVAGYIVRYEQLSGAWGIGWKTKSVVVRYMILLPSVFTFSIYTHDGHMGDGLLLVISVSLFAVYVVIASFMFYRDLRNHFKEE